MEVFDDFLRLRHRGQRPMEEVMEEVEEEELDLRASLSLVGLRGGSGGGLVEVEASALGCSTGEKGLCPASCCSCCSRDCFPGEVAGADGVGPAA